MEKVFTLVGFLRSTRAGSFNGLSDVISGVSRETESVFGAKVVEGRDAWEISRADRLT